MAGRPARQGEVRLAGGLAASQLNGASSLGGTKQQ